MRQPDRERAIKLLGPTETWTVDAMLEFAAQEAELYGVLIDPDKRAAELRSQKSKETSK